MKVNGSFQEHKKVDVSYREVVEALYKHFDLKSCFIKDNAIYSSIEQGAGTHSWFEESFVTKDKEKIEILNALNILRKYT